MSEKGMTGTVPSSGHALFAHNKYTMDFFERKNLSEPLRHNGYMASKRLYPEWTAAKRPRPEDRRCRIPHGYAALPEHIVNGMVVGRTAMFQGMGRSVILQPDREPELSPLEGNMLVKRLPQRELPPTLRRYIRVVDVERCSRPTLHITMEFPAALNRANEPAAFLLARDRITGETRGMWGYNECGGAGCWSMDCPHRKQKKGAAGIAHFSKIW